MIGVHAVLVPVLVLTEADSCCDCLISIRSSWRLWRMGFLLFVIGITVGTLVIVVGVMIRVVRPIMVSEVIDGFSGIGAVVRISD
jgi:hypothetical protein